MTAVAFLHSKAVSRVLERASRAAGMPAAIHHVDSEGHEGKKVNGCGQCAACGYVAGLPGGAEACQMSRARNSQYALKVKKPATFLCHMGFACVSAPALPSADQGFVLTMGPYCPAEAPELLMEDAMRGLVALGQDKLPFFPVPLSGINHVRGDSVPALAEWAVATIETIWQEEQGSTQTSPPSKWAPRGSRGGRCEPFRDAVIGTTSHPLKGDFGGCDPSDEDTDHPTQKPVRGRPRRLRSKLPDNSPYRGAEIAAALASGDQTLARTLTKTAIAETDHHQGSTGVSPVNSHAGARKRHVTAALRARAVALVSATLEAAEHARTDTTESWDQFPAFLNTVRQAQADTDVVKAVMALLSPLVPRRQTDTHDNVLAELDRAVIGRMPGPVQLSEIAQRLGKHPTAITHHLQRKYGLSFSQYVARLRIDKAKELLRRTRLGVGEVATRVGVADQSNFTKLFRKFEGLSPVQYREQYRTGR